MEICVKCFFDNKSDFDKALNYLESIDNDIVYNDKIGDLYIETYRSITQAQLNELTALCPIRPRVEVSKEAVRNKIAYMIGRFGAGYHPEDDVHDLIDSDNFDEVQHFEIIQNDIDYMCDKLGLDPCAVTLDLLAEFGITPKHLND